MTVALPRYETQGSTWAERAAYGELEAVLSPTSPRRRNLFLHGVNLFGARQALELLSRTNGDSPKVVDFGCGTGRFVRYFGSRGCSVLGLDITPEMLVEARRFGLPPGCELQPTDGVSIPLSNATVDLVWVCGVLKYSLFINPLYEFVPQPDPTYPLIAREMFRVLRPGAWVLNQEIYVNVPASAFVHDFEKAGFVTRQVRVVQRHGGRPERICQSRWIPSFCTSAAAGLCAAIRYWLDDVRRIGGISDYMFIWQKPQ